MRSSHHANKQNVFIAARASVVPMPCASGAPTRRARRRPGQPAAAEAPTPFLTSPYYGTTAINSFFDHEYPNYGINGSIVLYTGERRFNADPRQNRSDSCTVGVSCYDGHDGYDFNVNYDRVLAAADGTVTIAYWQDRTDRTRSWGLYIELDHGNGYITRYGHLSAVTVVLGQQVRAGQIIGTEWQHGAVHRSSPALWRAL